MLSRLLRIVERHDRNPLLTLCTPFESRAEWLAEKKHADLHGPALASVLKPGDLVLSVGGRKSSRINLWGQRLFFRRRRAKYSHVALAVGPCVLVDALPRQPVWPRSALPTLLDRTVYPEVKVLRHRGPHDADLLRRIVNFHLGKTYNYAIGLPKLALYLGMGSVGSTAFCSELVCNILEPAGRLEELELDLLHERVMPADLQSLDSLESSRWSDVTQEVMSAAATACAARADAERAVAFYVFEIVFDAKDQQLKANAALRNNTWFEPMFADPEAAFPFLDGVAELRRSLEDRLAEAPYHRLLGANWSQDRRVRAKYLRPGPFEAVWRWAWCRVLLSLDRRFGGQPRDEFDLELAQSRHAMAVRRIRRIEAQIRDKHVLCIHHGAHQSQLGFFELAELARAPVRCFGLTDTEGFIACAAERGREEEARELVLRAHARIQKLIDRDPVVRRMKRYVLQDDSRLVL